MHILYTLRVGQHVVAGSPLAFVWTDTDTPVDPRRSAEPVAQCIRIGFERTLEQDAAFGIRQLVDIACKALSPAVNDPYTAVQAIHHLTTILALLAPRPLGHAVIRAGPSASVTAPALDFDGYLELACAQIRRYGSTEPAIPRALIEMLVVTARALAPDASGRRASIANQLTLILADAELNTSQPADLVPVRQDGNRLKALLT